MQSPTQVFQTPASYNGTRGVLAFDGNRLTFSYTTGFFTKHQLVPLSIPAPMIVTVAVEGSFHKKLVVTTSQTDTIPRHEFEVREPLQWLKWLSDALKPAIPKGDVVIREVTREVKFLIKCSHCGFHAEQGTVKCPNCGGPL